MPETLTESFCERCGTRYEFKAPTRLNPLRKTRGFVSGLRNYIMSQDALGDALDDAMRTEENTLASRQLEAFHESFNFCIDCRQYACVSCWNNETGRCRSCAPVIGTDDLMERMEASFQGAAGAGLTHAHDADPFVPVLGVDTWPSEDLVVPANGNGSAHFPGLEPQDEPVEAIPEPEVIAEEAWAEPGAAEADAPAAPEQVAAEPWTEPEPVATEAWAEPEPSVLAWEDDDSFELQPVFEAEPFEPITTAEHEPIFVAASEADAEPDVLIEAESELVAAAEIMTEPAIEPDTEPMPAGEADLQLMTETAHEPEPEPVVAETEAETEAKPAPPLPFDRPITPVGDTIVRLPKWARGPQAEPVAAEADDPGVAARRSQLDDLGLGDPGQGPISRQRPTALPYRSSGAGVSPIELVARAGTGSFWEASAREVAQGGGHVGVQSCGQCGLSLSASARFCRRCGTSQARSA